MTKTVLILGASGKIGLHSAQAFAAAGWTVRKYDRATNDITAAAMGCDVIVNGMNPPNYENWETFVPQSTAAVITAAKASGAVVIIPGNVYVYGDHAGTWGPTTPHRTHTRKGKLRIDMEATYRKAANDGVRTIILRGGDFLDPNRDGTLMSLVVLNKIAKGKLTTLGPTDVNHAYAYVPDWARAAVALAEKSDQLNSFEDVPFPGTTFTMDELRDLIARETGKPVTFTPFPWWFMRLASPFWGLAKELLEMRYLSAVPHQLSRDRFDALLPDFKETPRRDIMLAELPAPLKPAP